MLRGKIFNKTTEKDELVLQLNHNYYIRTTIVTVAKLVVVGAIFAAVLYVINIVAIQDSKNVSGIESLAVAYGAICLVYLGYFIAQVASLVSLYHQIDRIEDKICGLKEQNDNKNDSSKE